MTASASRDVAQVLAEVMTADPVVDLRLPLDETLPCAWAGHMPYRATVWSWFSDRPDAPSRSISKWAATIKPVAGHRRTYRHRPGCPPPLHPTPRQ